jgi:hypothetical protein
VLGRFKDISFRKAEISTTVTLHSPKVFEITVLSKALSPFVCLQTSVRGHFSNNAFLMLPEVPLTVKFYAEEELDLKAFCAALEAVDLRSTYS